MTPLAQKIVRDMLLPRGKRTFVDRGGLLNRMDDIHCFEVTAVCDLAQDLVPDCDGFLPPPQHDKWETFSSATSDTAFLPAQKTWIEYGKGNLRRGYLLIDGGTWAEVRTATFGDRSGFGCFSHVWKFGLSADGGNSRLRRYSADLDEDTLGRVLNDAAFLQATLCLINTPRIIGRTQHMPHRGLERTLLTRRRDIGVFPLNAYTTIKLHVMRPAEDLSEDPPSEAHLTGTKALHFCRAHLRCRMGRVEIVRGHWRGDASLGVKRSRYEIRP